MVLNLDTVSSSSQLETTKLEEEKIISIQLIRGTKFRDVYKIDKPFGRSYIDCRRDFKKEASGKHVDKLKSSEDHRKQLFGVKACRHDELVKHMSNLPGYLQQAESRESIQEKALNFGVLGWECLEQWKHSQKHTPSEGNRKESSSGATALVKTTGSSNISSTARSKVPLPQPKKPPSHSFDRDSLHGKRLPRAVKKSEENPGIRDLRKKPSCSSNMEQHLHKYDKSCRLKQLERANKEESEQMIKLEKRGSSLSSQDTVSFQDDQIKTRTSEKFNLAHQHSMGNNENIVLLFPKNFSKKGCSESSCSSESRTILAENFMEESGMRFSDCRSSEEHHSGDLCSRILHSSPLTATGMIDTTEMKRCRLVNSHGRQLEPNVCVDGIPFMASDRKYREEAMSNPELSFEVSKRLDEDNAQLTAMKGRHSSPHRRFSLSLSKMSRSLSFKEGSDIQPLSSPYTFRSGPVRSEASDDLYSTRDKTTTSSRARSSPLRRLLDPLLKTKGIRNNETPLPSKGVPKSVSLKSMKSDQLFQDDKHQASTVQALLQLTIKNELPFFKLVVNNSSDVLVAGVRTLPISENNCSSLTYAIYKVHEIKRKSGSWINQGSKGKSSGLGYKLIGQMKVSSSSVADTSRWESTDHYMVIESVLYCIDLGQTDLETPEFMASKELAAIVVENLSKKNPENKHSSSKDCTLKRFYKSFDQETRVNLNSFRATIILPGGTHGLPNEGAPSPLIDRWRSGGSCDCGGWDVGCKLRVLTNHAPSTRSSRLAISSSFPGHFHLFFQGGDQISRPIFSMAPCKNGLYSIEFDASSISLLQAFSICVTAVSSQKSFEILELNNKSELKLFPEPVEGSQSAKFPIRTAVEVATKYVPQPPPSPVGRV